MTAPLTHGRSRFDALRTTLDVHAAVRTVIPHRNQICVAIAESAHLLGNGQCDLFVVGSDTSAGIAYAARGPP